MSTILRFLTSFASFFDSPTNTSGPGRVLNLCCSEILKPNDFVEEFFSAVLEIASDRNPDLDRVARASSKNALA